MKDKFIGDKTTDLWDHIWGHKKNLQNLHKGTLFHLWINELKYPEGGNYFWIDYWNTLLMFPLSLIMDFPDLYNSVIILNFALSALGAFILIFYLTEFWIGSFIAGIIYGFSPCLISHAANGISEQTAFYALPLFIFIFINFLRLMSSLYEKRNGFELQTKSVRSKSVIESNRKVCFPYIFTDDREVKFRRSKGSIVLLFCCFLIPVIFFSWNLFITPYSICALTIFMLFFPLTSTYLDWKNKTKKANTKQYLIFSFIVFLCGLLLFSPYFLIFLKAHSGADSLNNVEIKHIKTERT